MKKKKRKKNPIIFYLNLFINVRSFYASESRLHHAIYRLNTCASTIIDFFCFVFAFDQGLLINLGIILIRDGITLIIEIFASALTIKHYRIYCVKHTTLIKPVKLNLIQEISSFFNKEDRQLKQQRRKERKLAAKKNIGTRKMLMMTIIMSILSIVSHIFVIVVYGFNVTNFAKRHVITYYYLHCFGCFSMNFKHFSNIFIFYKFNPDFRKKFKEITCRKTYQEVRAS